MELVQLDRETILDAAINILREYGLGDLSMRRLAKSVNLAVAGLYWYYPSKQALLGAIADKVIQSVTPSDDPVKFSVAVYDALTSIPDAAEITLAAMSAGTLSRDLLGDFRRVCENRGDIAYHYVLGAALETQSKESWFRAQGIDAAIEPPDIAAGVQTIMR